MDIQRTRHGFGVESLERCYKGYIVEGSAQPLGPHSDLWFDVATVLLNRPDKSVLQVDRYQDSLLTYDDGDLAAWFGLGIAEIAVDRCLPPPSYYLTPLDVARAVDILRRGAEDHHNREIRKPPLYEALTLLEQYLEKRNWLVRRYRNALRGDTRNQREKLAQRQQLRVCFRGIQQAWVERISSELNDLALHYRENKAAIDKTSPAARRRALAISKVIRRPNV